MDLFISNTQCYTLFQIYYRLHYLFFVDLKFVIQVWEQYLYIWISKYITHDYDEYTWEGSSAFNNKISIYIPSDSLSNYLKDLSKQTFLCTRKVQENSLVICTEKKMCISVSQDLVLFWKHYRIQDIHLCAELKVIASKTFIYVLNKNSILDMHLLSKR